MDTGTSTRTDTSQPGVVVKAWLHGSAPMPTSWRVGRLELHAERWIWKHRSPRRHAPVVLTPKSLALEGVRATVAREALSLDRSCTVFVATHFGAPFEVAVLPEDLPLMRAAWPQP